MAGARMTAGRARGAANGNGRRGGPPGGIAEQGRLWLDKGTRTSRGKNAEFGWALHARSWTRCVAFMTPKVGPVMARPLCAKRFHQSLGVWPGSHLNTGKGGGRRR